LISCGNETVLNFLNISANLPMESALVFAVRGHGMKVFLTVNVAKN